MSDEHRIPALTGGQIDDILQAMADSFGQQLRSPVLHWPSEQDLDYEDVTFPALDGVPLEGWFIPTAFASRQWLWRWVHHERAAAAQADRLGYRLVAAVTENLQCGRVARIVVKREYRPGGEGELLAKLAGQLRGQRAVVKAGFGQRGG